MLCLDQYNNQQDTIEPVSLNADGAAIIYMLDLGAAKRFKYYSQNVFIPYLIKKLHKVSRLDLVWDMYKFDSLKVITRDNRGHGQRSHISDNSNIHSNWK